MRSHAAVRPHSQSLSPSRRNDGWGEEQPLVFERLFAIVSDLMVVATDAGEIMLVNPASEDTLGWSPQELVGRSVCELVHPEDQASIRAIEDPTANFTNRCRHKDGSWRWLMWSGRKEDGVWYAVAKDVTQRLDLERRALYDDLTGLANRALLLDHLHGALTRLGRGQERLLAVLFLDLDGFKLINDGHGHEAGDQVLLQVAGRLRQALRDADVISRFGGDEFVIVAEDLGSEAEAISLAERIAETINQEFSLGGRCVSLSCSVGIATTNDPRSDHDALLREADSAMYRAKTSGSGCCQALVNRREVA
ncbi:MAG: sensor domain-containing diguanylate cyclase [Solirubrobacteraceae bacterium]